jgi:hypothetical protein
MKTLNTSLVIYLRGAVLAGLAAAPLIHAATIWNGPTVNVSDATEPDKITAHVWLTRGGNQGLYNALTESGFTHFFSPADTEWADGTTANYNSLSYTNWNSWAKGVHTGPPSTVGVNAVVHLKTDDIYIDIKFTSWSVGSAYSYQRSTLAVSNNPPAVTITNPVSGAVFAAPANVTIQATVTNGSGTVTNVQFLVGSTVLTNVTANPFSGATNNLAAGSYNLSAIAFDNLGVKNTNTVSISVVTPVQTTLSGAAVSSSTNFQFSYSADVGLSYIVQRSTDLASASWITLVTNVAASNPVVFLDIYATNNPNFYRVGRLPNP